MANIREKAISILAENLNLGRSYLITTVIRKSGIRFGSIKQLIYLKIGISFIEARGDFFSRNW